jgi:Omp85 superfamily domain
MEFLLQEISGAVSPIMSVKIPWAFHLLRVVLSTALITGYAVKSHAQEVPPDPPQATADPSQARRIVDGRPPLYFFKRDINPFTWLEAGVEPIFRSAESGRLARLVARPNGPEKTSGIKVGLDGAGANSGFGPLVTLFHKELLGPRIEVEVPLLFTYKRYEEYRFNTFLPLISEGRLKRLTFDVESAYRSRPTDGFFGIGNDSRYEDFTEYRTVHREAGIGLTAQINDIWKSGVHLTYQNVGVTEPFSVHFRSAQDIFRDAGVPGLSSGGTLRSMAFVLDRDTQDSKNLPAEGSREHLEISLNEGIGKGDFSYWKYRFDFQKIFVISREKRKAIAVRASTETNQEKGGSRVPFWDMPVVGNWETLRGFDNYRFRDKSALSFGVEYRYRIWEALDWALFLDEGQVAPDPRNFGLDRFHSGYGVRLMSLPKPNWPITVELGRSAETWRLYVNFNPRF